MKCKEVIELMQRNLDNDLNELEKKRLDAHLDSCPSCTQMFYRLSMLSHGLEQLPKVEPVYSIVDAILPRIESLEQEKTSSFAAKESKALPSGIEDTHETSSPRRVWKIPSWGGWVAAGIALMIGVYTLADQGPMRFQSGQEVAQDSTMMDKSEEGQSTMEIASVPYSKENEDTSNATSKIMDVESDSTASTESAPASEEEESASMSHTSSLVEEDRMPSPNGTWVAIVKENLIHIENDRGEIVYNTTLPREANERVVLTMWSEDGKTVYYEVAHANGTFSQWEIHMETWVEQQVSR
jgi:hypothetical protein